MSVDEAHYFLYGLYPDYSYFDHPPLVGWLNALPVHLNSSEGVIRFIPEVLWVVSIILNVYLTKTIIKIFLPFADENIIRMAPIWVILSVISSPLMHVLSVGLLPDSILMVLVPLIFILTLKIHLELRKDHPKDMLLWIFLGITLGFSGLTKYTAILFSFGIFICLMTWHGFFIFSRVGLWFCLILALVFLTPIFYWNMLHNWISFKYQFNHSVGSEWKIHRFGLFFLIQICAYGFLLVYGLIQSFYKNIKLPKCLYSFSLLPLFIFAILSGNGRSLPHWTAPAWIAGVPFVAISCANAWILEKKRLIIFLFAFQMMIISIAFIILYQGGIQFTIPHKNLKKVNPVADLFGWDVIGGKMNQLSQEHHVQNFVAQNWIMGSRLAWYTKSKHVYILDNRNAQFEIWFGKLPVGSDVLLLQWSQMPYPLPVNAGQFSKCEKISYQSIKRFEHVISKFYIFRCINWQGTHSLV